MSSGAEGSGAEGRRAAAREDLKQAHRELFLLARGAAAAGSRGPSAPARAWHLVRGAERLRESLRLAPPGPRPKPSLIERQAWLSLRTTWQVPAALEWIPEIPVEGSLPVDLEERATRAVGGLLGLLDELPAARLGEIWWQHPSLGPLSAFSWCRLLRILARHHALRGSAPPPGPAPRSGPPPEER